MRSTVWNEIKFLVHLRISTFLQDKPLVVPVSLVAQLGCTGWRAQEKSLLHCCRRSGEDTLPHQLVLWMAEGRRWLSVIFLVLKV